MILQGRGTQLAPNITFPSKEKNADFQGKKGCAFLSRFCRVKNIL
jgi:hypothetical protein